MPNYTGSDEIDVVSYDGAAFGVFVDLSAGTASNGESLSDPLPEGYFQDPETGHYYVHISSDYLSWSQAATAASSISFHGLNGYLATVTTESEWNFIRTTVFPEKQDNIYLGGTDEAVEGTWRWVTGPEGRLDAGHGAEFWRGRYDGHAENGLFAKWRMGSAFQESGYYSADVTDYLLMYSYFSPDFSAARGDREGIREGGGGATYLVEFNAGTTDTLTSIENIVGSRNADVIIGSSVSNALHGGDGGDKLDGGGNSDFLDGGVENDLIFGGEGDDYIVGGDGDDIIKGSEGNDVIYGNSPTEPSSIGSDTATYRGSHTDYTFRTIIDANGISGVSISDNRDPYTTLASELDGIDRVFQVETFRFADGTFTLAQLVIEPLLTNTVPVAVNDSYTMNEDTFLWLSTQYGLLYNDTDLDGDSLKIVSVTQGAHGAVILDDNGTPWYANDDYVTYSPVAGYSGSDSFTYTLSDGISFATASVSLTIAPVNDAPDAVDDGGYTTAFNTALNLAKATLLANDVDIDGDTLTVTSVSNASHGTVTISGNTVVFTPVTGYAGAAGFDYTISDGQGGTDTAHVSLTVAPQSAGGTTYNPLTNGDDTVSFANAVGPVLVGGLNGNDTITGSRFADTVNGGAGDDRLGGGAGKDVIIGGKGYDRVIGGTGNDTFVFAAGDLSNVSQVDHIVDFSGAGIAQVGAGEQDFIRFTGFGAGATLQFDHYGNAAHTLQYYRVVDPVNSANGGLILVQMAGGNTNQLISGDYHFY